MTTRKIGEFFAELGFNVKDEGLKKLNSGIESFSKKIVLLQTAIVASGVAMSKITNNIALGVAQLEKFAQNTGLAIDKLEKWQEAGQKIDITLNKENITNSIASLQKNLDEIKFGRGNIGAFQILGIEIGNKDAFQVLEDIRDRIQGLNGTEVRNLVEKMGLDASFVQLLKTSRSEFERLGEQTRLSSSQRGGLLQFGKQVKTLELNFIALKNQIASALAPSLTQFFTSLNKFIKNNSQNIVRGSRAIYNAIGQVISIFKTTLNIFQDFFGKEAGFIAFAAVLAKTFSPLKKLFSPMIIFFGLLIGLLDDIATWKAGGDSLFGDFYDAIDTLMDKLKPVYDLITKIRKEFFGGVLGEEVNGDATSGKSDSPEARNSLKNIGSSTLQGAAIGAGIGKMVGPVGMGGGALFGALLGFFGGMIKERNENLVWQEREASQLERAYADRGLTPPQTNNKTEVVNNMSFNIKSENPKEVANEVYNVLTTNTKSKIIY